MMLCIEKMRNTVVSSFSRVIGDMPVVSMTLRMAASSYVCPSDATTGVVIRRFVIGHTVSSRKLSDGSASSTHPNAVDRNGGRVFAAAMQEFDELAAATSTADTAPAVDDREMKRQRMLAAAERRMAM